MSSRLHTYTVTVTDSEGVNYSSCQVRAYSASSACVITENLALSSAKTGVIIKVEATLNK